MKTDQDNLFSEARASAGRAFERWIPRRCDHDWLRRLTGPSRFTWDIEAMQKGFVDPLYACYDENPERLRPALTARLLLAAGEDPMRHSVVLVASELPFLATLIVDFLKNGRNIGESMPGSSPIPMPVVVTVAFNARQMAPTLVSDHADTLSADARCWLAYRIGLALSKSGAARAVDFYRSGRRFANEAELLQHLRLLVGPLSFNLPVDCALAALGAHEAPYSSRLRQAATAAGVAYRIAVTSRPASRAGTCGPTSRGPTLHCLAGMTDDAEWSRRLRDLAAAQHREASDALAGVPTHLASAFSEFLDNFVGARLREMEDCAHAG
jgi:hypothetical protein